MSDGKSKSRRQLSETEERTFLAIWKDRAPDFRNVRRHGHILEEMVHDLWVWSSEYGTIFSYAKTKEDIHKHADAISNLNPNIKLYGKNDKKVISNYLVLSFLSIDLDDIDTPELINSILAYRNIYHQMRHLCELNKSDGMVTCILTIHETTAVTDVC